MFNSKVYAMRSSRILSVAATILYAGSFAASHAATDFAFQNLSGAEYDTAGVYVLGDVYFTGTTDDGSGFDDVLFELWDDYVVKFSAIYSLAVGTSGSFHFDVYYPGLVGIAAQGVGLYLSDIPDTGSGYAFYIDPYDVPHYSDPSQCRVDCGPMAPPVPIPASVLMLGGGMGGLGLLGLFGRRRRNAA